MNKHNADNIQAELEKKARQRAKRKKPAVKVSGASVKKLQKLIIKKSKT